MTKPATPILIEPHDDGFRAVRRCSSGMIENVTIGVHPTVAAVREVLERMVDAGMIVEGTPIYETGAK